VRTKKGRPREALQEWLRRLIDALHGRVHGLNVSVAHAWAEQQRQLDQAGQRMPIEDSYIAATARRMASPSSPATTGISADRDSACSIHSRN